MRTFIYLVAFILCLPTLSYSDEELGIWKNRARLSAVQSLDRFLSWSLPQQLRTYPFATPLEQRELGQELPAVRAFVTHYGYFSLHPLIGRVTPGQSDTELICSLLRNLGEQKIGGVYLELATAEILAKGLAYRDLQVGDEVEIPIEIQGTIYLEHFVVDVVFDIWHGMPAFGLLAEREGVASILLFRGTEFSFFSERAWASMLSDLDIHGPGFSAFQRAQSSIRQWLLKAKTQEKTARVMGFSLGGALASYAFIYERGLLADSGSITLCAPGISQEVISRWKKLPPKMQEGLISYVNAGDPVSKVGELFGSVYCLSTQKIFKPIAAHVALMTGLPGVKCTRVDVPKDNR